MYLYEDDPVYITNDTTRDDEADGRATRHGAGCQDLPGPRSSFNEQWQFITPASSDQEHDDHQLLDIRRER